jgi:hypothetical protein
LLVESSRPLWLLGTAFEHHTVVDYHFRSASNVLAIATQTENPYWEPVASESRAVIIENSSNIQMYGALYCNWFGHVSTLVNASGAKDVSIYGMVFNGADVAVGLNDPTAHIDAKGGVVGRYGGMVSDTPI